MSIIYILIPVAILLTAIGIYFFLWAVKTDQFSDLDKQGMSILFDDDNTKKRLNSSSISVSVNKSNQNDPS
mgnify:CR=1 FL=1